MNFNGYAVMVKKMHQLRLKLCLRMLYNAKTFSLKRNLVMAFHTSPLEKAKKQGKNAITNSQSHPILIYLVLYILQLAVLEFLTESTLPIKTTSSSLLSGQ